MLHGKGVGNYSTNDQSFLTESYSNTRKKGLRDRDKLTLSERNFYEISGAQGGGRTEPGELIIKQFPFPTDPTIKRKEYVDLRKIKPELGEMSD